MVDCDSESKNSKLDIIIEYLKKNNLENNYLRKLDNLNKKITSFEKNQLLILEKIEKIEKQLNPKPIHKDSNDNITDQTNDESKNTKNINSSISNDTEFYKIDNIHRLSNNIWRNNYPITCNMGLKTLTTPNLSLKHLNYQQDNMKID